MAHHYQKRWVFTWNSDDLGRLPNRQNLLDILFDSKNIMNIIDQTRHCFCGTLDQSKSWKAESTGSVFRKSENLTRFAFVLDLVSILVFFSRSSIGVI